MLFLTFASPNLAFPPALLDSAPNKPYFLFFPGRRPIRRGKVESVMGAEGIDRARSRCGICRGSGLVGRCRREPDGEGDPSLEADILEFMKGSDKPSSFPSKKQLLDAGREDLVEAISQRGGWLSLGWDLDCQDGSGFFQYDIDFGEEFGGGVNRELGHSNQPSRNLELESGDDAETSSSDSSPSGVSLEPPSEITSGIEGILSRLEKERNITFGVGLRDKGDNELISVDDVQNGSHHGVHRDEVIPGFEGRVKPTTSISDESLINDARSNITRTGNFSGLGNTNQSVLWRTWSTGRAGFSENDFEAAEIDLLRGRTGAEREFLKSDVVEIREKNNELTSASDNDISHVQIKSRLQHLEAELSCVLQSLRSKPLGDEEKSPAIVSENTQELSDAWEFQETEVLNAQDKLRSIRAKLAVLEGKMALAIIDAQKTVEEKQKRIEETHRALRLLRTACIVWPNSASEVLLAGSFDGWATQRKMEKSSTGIFTLCLKLYPGKYEIKFIVDGVWRIDPLRPIVNNNGYENNLLIIT